MALKCFTSKHFSRYVRSRPKGQTTEAVGPSRGRLRVNLACSSLFLAQVEIRDAPLIGLLSRRGRVGPSPKGKPFTTPRLHKTGAKPFTNRKDFVRIQYAIQLDWSNIAIRQGPCVAPNILPVS